MHVTRTETRIDPNDRISHALNVAKMQTLNQANDLARKSSLIQRATILTLMMQSRLD